MRWEGKKWNTVAIMICQFQNATENQQSAILAVREPYIHVYMHCIYTLFPFSIPSPYLIVFLFLFSHLSSLMRVHIHTSSMWICYHRLFFFRQKRRFILQISSYLVPSLSLSVFLFLSLHLIPFSVLTCICTCSHGYIYLQIGCQLNEQK